MPHINVDIIAPKSAQYRASVLEAVVSSCVDAIGAVPEAIIAQTTDHDSSGVIKPAGHSDDFTYVTIALYEGRSEESKIEYCAMLRARLADSLKIESHDVWVRFDDKSRVDLGVLHA